MSNFLTINQFIEKAKKIHGNKYSYSRVIYINSKTKVEIFCNYCEKYFLQQPNNHLNGQNCPFCRYEKKKPKLKEIIEKAKKIHGNKYDYNSVNYINCRVKIKIYCKKCKKYFFQTTSNHISHKQGCPSCHINKVKNKLKYLINKAKKIHNNKYDYSRIKKFYHMHKNVKIYCKKCKKYFYQSFSNHINCKQGCPICNLSKGENIIKNYLEKNNVHFYHQKRFKNCKNKKPLPFDFYLPNYNLLIEYDGKQHFEKNNKLYHKNIEKHDYIKTNFSKENNIRLLRIPYWKFNNIEKILKDLII